MNDRSEHAFSIRRLNPFNGVLQVFLNEKARALSSNGLSWEIQVLSDRPQGLWANMPFSGQQFYTFGRWSEQHGLKQVPVNPLFNVRDMIDSTDKLLEGLRLALAELPFPLADHFEQWLLDEQSLQPVALLRSCRTESEIEAFGAIKWIAAERGDFTFTSAHLLQRGVPGNDGYNPRVHASVMEALVRTRSGQHQRSGWFHRRRNGTVTPCRASDKGPEPGRFPELPLTEDWKDEEDRQLIADYIAWKAPQMLLPQLSDTTRARLERLAVGQAGAVDRLWRLYPEIDNKALLNRARIEAKIRTANRK
ncbi:MAG: hypothetical protein KZQ97_20255 [Candidatus Thiodiazotropha sp. (ex Dulcina madagascariensis)]|nr:hypothetical protein [Candidatus Thiodiazotropha sp. (ex Dulcina madagascariensis)]